MQPVCIKGHFLLRRDVGSQEIHQFIEPLLRITICSYAGIFGILPVSDKLNKENNQVGLQDVLILLLFT